MFKFALERGVVETISLKHHKCYKKYFSNTNLNILIKCIKAKGINRLESPTLFGLILFVRITLVTHQFRFIAVI